MSAGAGSGVLRRWRSRWPRIVRIRGRAVRGHHPTSYRREALRRVTGPAVGVAGTLLLWQAVVVGFGIRPFFLPAPTEVAGALVTHAPYLWQATRVTLGHTLAGFGVAAAAGVAAGLGLAAGAPLRRVVLPVLVALQATPKVALAPLLIAWLGFGPASKITLVALLSFFPVLLATLAGVTATPVELTELARSHRAAGWRTYLLIRVPWAAPQMFTGLHLGMSLALIGAVVAQITTPNVGLGAVIVRAGQSADTPLAFAAVALLAGLGTGLFALMTGVERRLLPWARAISG